MAAPPVFPSGAIGPADLTFGSTACGRSESVEITGKWNTADAMTAGGGSVPSGIYTAGVGIQVKANLAETVIATILALSPNSANTGSQLVWKNTVGSNLRDIADTLIIKPFVNGAAVATATKWLHVALCAPIPDFTLPYSVDGERYFNVVFRAFEVRSEDIATGGALYNSGSPLWPLAGMASIGLGETS